MRRLLGNLLLSFALLTPAVGRPLNLPGTLAAGVQVCNPHGCITTPGGKETPAHILSYQNGIVNARIGKETFVADPDDVVLTLKGCSLTLRSYLAKRFCPGWKP